MDPKGLPAVLGGLLLTVTFLSGCLANDGEDAAVDLAPLGHILGSLEGYVDPFILGHDHADAGLHDLAFHTQKLSHHGLGGDRDTPSGAHVLAIAEDWLFVGAWGPLVGDQGGVWIFDVREPAQPQLVSHLPFLGHVAGDRSLAVTPDASWVVFGTEAMSCGNQLNPFQPGLFLIDARDKTKPQVTDYRPARGIHSVSVGRVDGQDYSVSLFSFVPGTVASRVPQANQLANNIHRIDPGTGKFVDVGKVPIGHDTRIEQDALLGKPLLYVANVTDLSVYDFSNPADVKRLGRWAPAGMDATYETGDHYIHAIDVDVVEGRRILVTESEDLGGKPSPVWILDATELDAMDHLATWVNPARAPAQGDVKGDGVTTTTSALFSTHNPRIVDGRIYLSHYHAGAWILDVSTLGRALSPQVLGYFLPDENNGGYKPSKTSLHSLPVGYGPICYGGLEFANIPDVHDVEYHDGVLYVADSTTGLYAVQYDPTVVPRAP